MRRREQELINRGWVCVILIKMHYTHTHENVNEYIMIILKIVFPLRKWRKVYIVVNRYSYGVSSRPLRVPSDTTI